MKTVVNVPLARRLLCTVILVACLSVTGIAIAETIVTGQLTYDSETRLITSSTGNNYLGIDPLPNRQGLPAVNNVIREQITNVLQALDYNAALLKSSSSRMDQKAIAGQKPYWR